MPGYHSFPVIHEVKWPLLFPAPAASPRKIWPWRMAALDVGRNKDPQKANTPLPKLCSQSSGQDQEQALPPSLQDPLPNFTVSLNLRCLAYDGGHAYMQLWWAIINACPRRVGHDLATKPPPTASFTPGFLSLSWIVWGQIILLWEWSCPVYCVI